jgi:hypothetical protein
MIRRPEHFGEVWGEGRHTEVTAATRPSSRNSLGELWWEFRKIRPGASGEVRLEAECRGVDLIQICHRADWATDGGKPVSVGGFTVRGAHAAIRTRPTGDGGRVLYCRTEDGKALTGRFRVPVAGPQRLYVTVALPEAVAEAVTFGVQGAGPATEMTLDVTRRRTTVVADLTDYAGDVTLSLRPVGGTAPARLEIVEAWLVGIPVAAADLVSARPATCSSALPAPRPAALRDDLHYGPAVARIALGGARPTQWTGEWRVKTPDAPACLRALVGLAADTAAGGRARLSITVERDRKPWHLMRDLELTAPAKDDARGACLPAVIEASLHAELRGREVTVRLEAAAAGDVPVVLAVPCLRVCRD